MFRVCFTFAAIAVLVQTTSGQETEVDWKQHVISHNERTFNFKTVAKGTIPEHRFVLRNPLQVPIHIGDITSSCTCTTLHYDEDKTVLKTYEELVITARLRGDQFDGQRNSTIIVPIDKPNRTEIQLHIRGDIRTDLNISPRDFIDFGNVPLDRGGSRTLTVTYTGANSQWRIVDAKCEHDFIRTKITSDFSRIGTSVFRVNVMLDKSAPNGHLNTLLTLMSNDLENRREIPIPLRATVGTVIRVTPPSLYLGALQPGRPSPRRDVLLSGTVPFRITKIECSNPAIETPLVISADDTPRVRHIVPILYRNPLSGEGAPEDGVMRTTIRITTDIPELKPEFYVTASVTSKEKE